VTARTIIIKFGREKAATANYIMTEITNDEKEELVEEKIQVSQNQKKKKSFTLKRGLIIFAAFAVLFVFVFGLVVVSFPYASMNMYSNTGNQRMALSAATRFIGRNEDNYDAQNHPPYNSRFANAMLLAVNYSSDLMWQNFENRGFNDRRTVSHSRQLDRFSTAYVSFLTSRSLDIDIAMLADVNIPREEHVRQIYFHERVRGKQTTARYIHGINSGYHIWYMPASAYAWGNEEWLSDEFRLTMYEEIIQTLRAGFSTPIALTNYIRALNSITQILQVDLSRIGFYEHIDIHADNGFVHLARDNFREISTPAINTAIGGDPTLFNTVFSPVSRGEVITPNRLNNFTVLYEYLINQIEDLFELVTRNYGEGNSRERLTRLYNIHIVTEFIRTMYHVTQVMNNDRQNKYVGNLLPGIQHAAANWQNIFIWGRVERLTPSPPATRANVCAMFRNQFLYHYVNNL